MKLPAQLKFSTFFGIIIFFGFCITTSTSYSQKEKDHIPELSPLGYITCSGKDSANLNQYKYWVWHNWRINSDSKIQRKIDALSVSLNDHKSLRQDTVLKDQIDKFELTKNIKPIMEDYSQKLFRRTAEKDFYQFVYGPNSDYLSANNVSFDLAETKTQVSLTFSNKNSKRKFKHMLNVNVSGSPADNIFNLVRNQEIVPQASATFTWSPLIFHGIRNHVVSNKYAIKQKSNFCAGNTFSLDSLQHVYDLLTYQVLISEKLIDSLKTIKNLTYYTTLKKLDSLKYTRDELDYENTRANLDTANKTTLLQTIYQKRVMIWGSIGGGYTYENYNLFQDDITPNQASVNNVNYHGAIAKLALNFFLLSDMKKTGTKETNPISFRNHFVSLGVYFARRNNRKDLNEYDISYSYGNTSADTSQGISRSEKGYDATLIHSDYIVTPYIDYIWFFTKKRNVGLNLFAETNFFTNRQIHPNSSVDFLKISKTNIGFGVFVSIPDKDKEKPATNLSVQLLFNDVTTAYDPLTPNNQRISLSVKGNIPFMLGKK